MLIANLPIFEYCIALTFAITLQTKTKWKGDEDCHSRFLRLDYIKDPYMKKD